MAQIYFSKFNINSEIYKVYDDDGLKDKILKDVFDKMDEHARHTEKEKRRGEEEKDVTYKFCDLKKDEKTKLSVDDWLKFMKESCKVMMQKKIL